MEFGFVITALLAIAFGALLSRFAREKLSNKKSQKFGNPLDKAAKKPKHK